MNKIFTPRKLLIAVAILLIGWLLYPLIFGKQKQRDPEEVYIRLDSPPTNLNVFLAVGHGPSSTITRQIFHTMGDLDLKTMELKPWLIEAIPSVRLVQDGPHKGQFAYDFAIIPEAVWDNGTPVTANDVAFTLKIALHPDFPAAYRGYLAPMSDMEIDPSNPKKFTIYFRTYYMLALEALCGTPILPSYHFDVNQRMAKVPLTDFLDSTKTKLLSANPELDAFEKEFSDAKFSNDPNAVLGSGAYRLQVMNEQGAVLVKKQNWWGDKIREKYPTLQAYPKKLVYKVVTDDLAMENLIKTRQLDLIGGSINPAKFKEWQAIDSLKTRFDFLAQGFTQYNRWVLNLKNPILADPLVRKALSHVVDYDYLLNQVQRGMAVRIAAPMAPNKPFYNKNLPLPDFNIAKAREILASAGWVDANGDGVLEKNLNGQVQKLSLKVLVPAPSKTNELMSVNLKETCKQAGIEMQLVSLDIGTANVDTKNGNFDSALLGITSNPGLVEYYQRFHSKSLAPTGDNRSNYVSAEADRLIEAIRTEPDEARRNQHYFALQELLSRDLPEIPLLAPLQRIIVSRKFDPAVAGEMRPGYYEQFARVSE